MTLMCDDGDSIIICVDNIYTKKKILDALNGRYRVIAPEFDDDDGIITNIDGATVIYAEYEKIPFHRLCFTDSNNSKRIFFNSFCIRKGLIRKSQFSYIALKYSRKRPRSYLSSHVPQTYAIELDHPEYFDEIMNECYEVRDILQNNERILQSLAEGASSGPVTERHEIKKFILKPSMVNKGAGIYVFQSSKELLSIIEALYGLSDQDDDQSEEDWTMVREWIIQDYIDKPLLLSDRRKFHIRSYVICFGRMEVYLYMHMLALFALNHYPKQFGEIPSQSCCWTEEDMLAHLTNTCLQVSNSNFSEKQSVNLFSDLAEADENLKTHYSDIISQMEKILQDIFDAMAHEPTLFQPIDNAFEIYGIDFLIDENYKVWYLEANAFPDFAQTGDQLGDKVVGGLFKNLFRLLGQKERNETFKQQEFDDLVRILSIAM